MTNIEPLSKEHMDAIGAACEELHKLNTNRPNNIKDYEEFMDKNCVFLMLACEALSEAENFIRSQKAA